MYRAVMFVAFILAVLAAAEDDRRKCHRLHPAMMHCCTGITMNPEIGTQAKLKKCFDNMKPHHPPPPPPPHPPSCELDECIAKKLGFYGEDGNIDKEILTSLTEKQFENHEEFVIILKDKCINADISKHGLPDMCDFMKMKHCFHNQYLKNCPEWSDEGECNGIKDLIPDCTVDE